MLIDRWKFCLQSFAGALLMDLSKAFDTINHELLVAQLHVAFLLMCSKFC